LILFLQLFSNNNQLISFFFATITVYGGLLREIYYSKLIEKNKFHAVFIVLSNCIKNDVKFLSLFSAQIGSKLAIWVKLVYNIIKVVKLPLFVVKSGDFPHSFPHTVENLSAAKC